MLSISYENALYLPSIFKDNALYFALFFSIFASMDNWTVCSPGSASPTPRPAASTWALAKQHHWSQQGDRQYRYLGQQTSLAFFVFFLFVCKLLKTGFSQRTILLSCVLLYTSVPVPNHPSPQGILCPGRHPQDSPSPGQASLLLLLETSLCLPAGP